MSVFTHGVATKDKPYAVNDNQLIKGSCSEWVVEKITFKGASATQ